MRLRSLDHLVLTVASIDRTVAFYVDVLGMTKETFGPQQRIALSFGDQKINLHERGREIDPKSTVPTPGSADLCFLVDDVNVARETLVAAGLTILDGPVQRTGATGPVLSVYVRDPDGNLIELSEAMHP